MMEDNNNKTITASTDSDWQVLCRLLRDCYQQQPDLPLLLEEKKGLPLKDIFIDLELVQTIKTQETRQPISIEQLFNPLPNKADSKAISRVYLQGVAGVGKTTLLKHLAYRWAAEGLWAQQFDCVLYLPLREIVLLYENRTLPYSLEDILQGPWDDNSLFRTFLRTEASGGKSLITTSLKKALCVHLQQYPQRILLLIDGIDEVDIEHTAIAALLNYTPSYILTSRPIVSPARVERQVENTGFSADNQRRYIHQYFKLIEQPHRADSLIQWLETQSNLTDLTRIAINCQLLCAAWSNQPEFGENNDNNNKVNTRKNSFPTNPTITQLYDLLILQWQWRAIRRELKHTEKEWQFYDDCDIQQLYRECLQLLGYLAYYALSQTDGVIIPGALLKQAVEYTLTQRGEPITPQAKQQLLDAVLNLGILKRQGLVDSYWDDRYEPAHLTFIEYLAADYLAQGFIEPERTDARECTETALQRYQYLPKFANVWPFVAGRLATQRNTSGIIRLLLALLAIQPELVGQEQLLQWLACYNEAYEQIAQEEPLHNNILTHAKTLLLSWCEKDEHFIEKAAKLLLNCTKLAKISSWFINWFLEEKLPTNDSVTWEQIFNSIHPIETLKLMLRVDEKHFEKSWQIILSLFKYRLGYVFYLSEILIKLAPLLSKSLQNITWQNLLTSLSETDSHLHWQIKRPLATIATQLPESYHKEVCQALDTLLRKIDTDNHQSLTPALAAFVAIFPQLSELSKIDVWKTISPFLTKNTHWAVPETLTAIALQLPKSYQITIWDTYFPLSKEIDNEILQNKLAILTALTPQLPESLQIKIWQNILSLLKQPDIYWVAQTNLAGLISRLPELFQIEAWQTILPFLEADDSDVAQTAYEALTAVAVQLPKSFLIEAWQTILPFFSKENWRWSYSTLILTKLTTQLPESFRVEAWQTILPFLNIIDFDTFNTFKILDELAPQLPVSYLTKAWKEIYSFLNNTILINTIDAFEACRDALEALAQLVRHVPESFLIEAWQNIFTLLNESNANIQVGALQVLAQLTLRLPQKIEEIWYTLCSMEEKFYLRICQDDPPEFLISSTFITLINTLHRINRKAFAKALVQPEQYQNIIELLLFQTSALFIASDRNTLTMLINQQPYSFPVTQRQMVLFKEACSYFQPLTYSEHLRTLRQVLRDYQTPALALFTPSVQGESTVRNFIGGFAPLGLTQWAISLVRLRHNEHAFLILEGLQQVDGRCILLLQEIHFRYNNQQVTITIEDLLVEKLMKYASNYCYKGWAISQQQGQQLLDNIRYEQTDAQRGLIEYHRYGNTLFHALASSNGHRYHNCLSWAEEQLTRLNLPLERNWLDWVVVDPRRHLPTPSARDPIRCIIS